MRTVFAVVYFWFMWAKLMAHTGANLVVLLLATGAILIAGREAEG